MASNSGHVPEPKNFEPKNPVHLDPPKNDPISVQRLSQCDGKYSLPVNELPLSLPLALHKRRLARERGRDLPFWVRAAKA